MSLGKQKAKFLPPTIHRNSFLDWLQVRGSTVQNALQSPYIEVDDRLGLCQSRQTCGKVIHLFRFCPAGRMKALDLLKTNECDPRFRINLLFQVSRTFGEDQLTCRSNCSAKQVTTMRGAVGSPHDKM